MLPLLNGKSFLECTERDLQTLINNPDFRENQYIDYKSTFSMLEKTGTDKEPAIAEFRSDICSFANAEGGYLIYGIKETQGLASEITGVEIQNNPDKFELERRNNLSAISPKIPSIQFGFIPLENNRYVVIIEIKPDFYVPYMHIEKEKNYHIYTRNGNRKVTMKYDELRRMFNSSMSFEYELENFRKERIEYYKSLSETAEDEYSKFVLLHLIPRTFTDPATYKQVYIDFRTNKKNYRILVSNTKMNNATIPNVDGITFAGYETKAEARLYNNGVFEVFYPKTDICKEYNDGIRFRCETVWNGIESIIYNYNHTFIDDASYSKYYICISIIDCKNVVTEESINYDSPGAVDRDNILCPPVEVNLSPENACSGDLTQQAHLNYLLSLGLRGSDELKKIIDDIKEKNQNNV